MTRLALAALLALSACVSAPNAPAVTRSAVSSIDLPPMKTFGDIRPAHRTRPNSMIAQDFLDLAFQLESGRSVPVMTRFDGPIGVRVAAGAPASLAPDLRALIARLRSEAGIDISLTGAADAAITIEAVSRAQLQQAVPRAACFVVPRVASWHEFQQVRRSAQVDWTTLERRDRAAIFVPSDVSPQEIRDCLHEELAQALGPLNDLYRLPDSIFNDDNIHAVLTPFDMLILRAYNAPQLRNGMTKSEAAARIPAILAELNPAGQGGYSIRSDDGNRAWADALEQALDPSAPVQRRRAAAQRAMQLARSNNWGDTREAFSLLAYGRLEVGHDAELALGVFKAADSIYRQSPITELHRAHIAVQLAAFSLSSGDHAKTLTLTREAAPIAEKYQNASLLATLLMFQAEALKLSGRTVEAQAVRLDSLAWARYGFGSERNVRERVQEVAELSPAN